MSANEILVAVFGLFVGYWVVAKLFSATPQSKFEETVESNEASQPGNRPNGADASPAWHHVLELSPHATADEIRAAYTKLMGQYHPDKVATLGEDLKELAERKSKEINGAYRQALRLRGIDA